MRQRSDIYYFCHFYTCTMYGADSRLTTIARTFHIRFHLPQAEIKSDFSAILRCHLRSIRSVFL